MSPETIGEAVRAMPHETGGGSYGIAEYHWPACRRCRLEAAMKTALSRIAQDADRRRWEREHLMTPVQGKDWRAGIVAELGLDEGDKG